MQLNMVRVPIERDRMVVVDAEVGEHEVAVLQAVHGEQVLAAGIRPSVDESGPRTMNVDPTEEYHRLARLYGRDKESGRPYVDIAYTHLRDFTRELESMAGVQKRKAA